MRFFIFFLITLISSPVFADTIACQRLCDEIRNNICAAAADVPDYCINYESHCILNSDELWVCMSGTSKIECIKTSCSGNSPQGGANSFPGGSAEEHCDATNGQCSGGNSTGENWAAP